MTIRQVAATLGLSGLLLAGEAGAQGTRRVAVEGVGGWAGYVDDATIDHTILGASVRLPLTDRLSVGPELVYSNGPGRARNVSLLGSLWFDLAPTTTGTRIVPFLVVGGGYQRQRDLVDFASGEGAFTAGGGARIRLGARVYIGGDVRVGWELHLRAAAHVGVRWPGP